MKTSFPFFLSLLLARVAVGQTTGLFFNEANYVQVSKGIDPDNSFNKYVVIYRSSIDTNYLLKKVYLDSSCSDLMSKSFMKSNLAEGPFFVYAQGNLSIQGAFKSGKWDGERKTYTNNVLTQKASFNEGLKTGIWEEYSQQGMLKRKTTYDINGNVTSDIRY